MYEGLARICTHKVVLAQISGQLQSSLFELFGALSSTTATPRDLLDAWLRQLQAQMTELKTAVGRSHDVGFLEDYTQAMDLDVRAEESQLHQLTEVVATMQASLKGMQDQLAFELVKFSTVSFISKSFAKYWFSFSRSSRRRNAWPRPRPRKGCENKRSPNWRRTWLIVWRGMRALRRKRSTMGDLDPACDEVMKRVQERWPHVIQASVKMENDYSVRRSLRRGSIFQTQNQGIPVSVVDANQCWRKHREITWSPANHGHDGAMLGRQG
jgi:hypothetical protein